MDIIKEPGMLLIPLLRFALFLVPLLACTGCATVPDGSVPVNSSEPSMSLPSATRVLGRATVYISATGQRLEVIHDTLNGIAIVILPEGGTAVLREEIAGSAGRYRDNSMVVWEFDGAALLWVKGELVFSGRVVK